MDENREYDQQQFIESVVASLRRATHDDEGTEYVRKFAMLVALCVVEATREKDIVQIRGSFPAVREMFEECVLFPTYAFGKDWVEQHLLFGKIAEKLLTGSVMPALYGAANRQEFEKLCAE